MKNHTRGFVLILLLILTFVLAACGEDGSRSGADARAALGDDPKARIIEILNVPDRIDRVQQLIDALAVYPPDQAQTLGELLRDRQLPFRDLERVLLIAGWARIDPPAATEWTITWERPGPMRNEEIGEAIGAWARQDPHALVQAYDVAALSGTVGHAIVALVEGWFGSGQNGLEQYVQDLGAGDIRDRAIGTLVRLRVARDGSKETETWALRLIADANFKSQVYSRLGGEMTFENPEEAIAWCEQVCDTPLGESVRHRTAVKWAEHDPKAAMDWMFVQDPTDVENQATIRAVYRRFQMADFSAAVAWMDATTEDDRRSPLLQGPVGMYINRHTVLDPMKSIAWTDYLMDESERELTLITIARRWLRRDPDAAEAWLVESSLSEEAKMEAHGPPVRHGVSQRKKK
jgi:hypothetical protein